MAKVVLQKEVAQEFTDGVTDIEVEAKNVRQLIKALDQKYPGMGERLRARAAVAIDGEIFQDPFLEAVGADSEVYFLPKIEGG
jgi:sulfur-carrier protein